MIEFHGRPFLEYLIEQLRDQGFVRILLLLGYLPDVVRNYFRDGRDFGVSIEYVVTSVEDETGSRLRAARDRIDNIFLLLYCDNYAPFSFEKIWATWNRNNPLALVTVYANEDNYTKSNIKVDTNGRVVTYDKLRTSEGLSGVDIGYMLADKKILDLIPEGNVSLEATVYPHLVAQGRLYAQVTRHRYYSVGDHQRLSLTKAFLSRCPTVLLDRDGVLNKKMPRGEYVRSWSEWTWIEGALEALRLLHSRGYRVIVITNQAGIARGSLTEAELAIIHDRMKSEVEKAGGQIDKIYYCPHGWDEGCHCRKPAPGMLFQAQRDYQLELTRCLYIGDDTRDQDAADAAGCPFQFVNDEVSLLDIAKSLIHAEAQIQITSPITETMQ
jgi:D-glycero-D-manno-heptose 1,7-bisphosphate phosphatase